MSQPRDLHSHWEAKRRRGKRPSGQSFHSHNLFCQDDNYSVQRLGHLHDRLCPQYHPVGRYLPFTDEKTEFQGASFAQGPRPGKVGWGGFSPAVLTVSLRFFRGRWGPGHKTGAGVRASSSFCPLKPQTAGAGLVTAAPRSLGTRRPLHSRGRWPVDPSWRAWPWPRSRSPFGPRTLPSTPSPRSRNPRTQRPAPHWPAWEHLPLFGQAAPGRLHPQPSPRRPVSLTSSF